MKVAVVGATGLVGSKVLQVLAERNFPVTEIIPVASERSVGKEIDFKGKKYKVVGMEEGIAAKPALAIFSAGGGTSLEWAPKFAEAGITVIDNSSSWRMDPTKKLVVPEINADVLTREDKIIANPSLNRPLSATSISQAINLFAISSALLSSFISVSSLSPRIIPTRSSPRDCNKVYLSARQRTSCGIPERAAQFVP